MKAILLLLLMIPVANAVDQDTFLECLNLPEPKPQFNIFIDQLTTPKDYLVNVTGLPIKALTIIPNKELENVDVKIWTNKTIYSAKYAEVIMQSNLDKEDAEIVLIYDVETSWLTKRTGVFFTLDGEEFEQPLVPLHYENFTRFYLETGVFESLILKGYVPIGGGGVGGPMDLEEEPRVKLTSGFVDDTKDYNFLFLALLALIVVVIFYVIRKYRKSGKIETSNEN